jgi:hypothetical protein
MELERDVTNVCELDERWVCEISYFFIHNIPNI